MARLLPLILVTCYVVQPFPCQPLVCSTAGCRYVPDVNTPCEAHYAKDHYEQMRSQCCPSGTPTQAVSSTRTCSCGTPSPSPSSSPSSAGLTLFPSPISYTDFSLNISWDTDSYGGPASGGSDYQHRVEVYESTHDSNFCLQCSYINQSENSITIPSIPFDGERSRITVKLVNSSGVEINSSIHRKNCYSLYQDPNNRKRYCGPEAPKPVDMDSVQVQSLAGQNGLVDAMISWQPPSDPGEQYVYYLYLTHQNNLTVWSTNTTVVVVQGFNSSTKFNLKIFSTIACVGVYKDKDLWEPCSGGESKQFTFSPVTSTSHVTTVNTQQPSMLYITTTTTTTTPTPSATLEPTRSAALQEDSKREVTLVAILVAAAVPVAVVLMALTIIMIKHCTKKPPLPPKLEMDSITASPEHTVGGDAQLQEEATSVDTEDSSVPEYLPGTTGYLPDAQCFGVQPPPSYIPNPTASVLILYSLETPEEELEMVVSLLVGGLAQYNIQAVAPSLASPRDMGRDWVEGRVREADAVLLFCNQQFYEEWTTSDQREGEDRVGYWVRQLKDNVKDLKKFAYVYMEEADRQYSELTLYIGRRFCITRNMDTTRNIDIESIAKFVWNAPNYTP